MSFPLMSKASVSELAAKGRIWLQIGGYSEESGGRGGFSRHHGGYGGL